MDEAWAHLDEEGFSLYAISNYGEVQNLRTHRILEPSVAGDGRSLKVNLMHDDGSGPKTFSISRGVGRYFVHPGETRINDTPMHLDGDPSNNRADNLMWRPRWLALKYRQQHNRMYIDDEQISFEEKYTGTHFNFVTEAARHFGVLPHDIYRSIMTGNHVHPGQLLFVRV